MVLAGLVLDGAALWADSVRGYVVNPVTGTRVGGVEVAFYLQQGPRLEEVLRQTTDAQGRFEFSGPFLNADLSFALAAFYQGVPHYTATLELGAQKELILEVYESTRADPHLRIVAHHLFLSLTGTQLDVAHLVQIDNLEDKTYIGQGEEDPQQVTEFALPPGVFNLQSHSGSLIQAGSTRFFDTQPLLPGRSQITFTFSLDPQQLDKGYVHRVRYPTDHLEIFLQPSTLQPGAPFEDLGVADLHGSQYRRLRLTELERGQRVLIPLPLDRPRRWMLKWAALGTVLLSGILALVLSRGLTASSPESVPDPGALRQYRRQLLEQLARLDDAYVGRADDRRYRNERARLVEQSLAVSRLLEGRDGGE